MVASVILISWFTWKNMLPSGEDDQVLLVFLIHGNQTQTIGVEFWPKALEIQPFHELKGLAMPSCYDQEERWNRWLQHCCTFNYWLISKPLWLNSYSILIHMILCFNTWIYLVSIFLKPLIFPVREHLRIPISYMHIYFYFPILRLKNSKD